MNIREALKIAHFAGVEFDPEKITAKDLPDLIEQMANEIVGLKQDLHRAQEELVNARWARNPDRMGQ